MELARRPVALLCGGVLFLILFLAIAGPSLVPHSPTQTDLTKALLPPVFMSGGIWRHPLGTDALGRDVLVQIMYGGRFSLFIGTVAVLGSLVLGTAAGVASGAYGGTTDTTLMALAEIQLGLPNILLALMFVPALGTSVGTIIVVLLLSGWPMFARMARGEVLSLREREFVVASRALGNSERRIMLHHLIPNIISSMLVLAAVMFGRMILLESTLNYLGLGVAPPTQTWGGGIFAGQSYLAVAWWIATFPGLILTLTVVTVNLLGDAIRDVYGPGSRGE